MKRSEGPNRVGRCFGGRMPISPPGGPGDLGRERVTRTVELRWANKSLHLLAEGAGQYTWAESSDPRVSMRWSLRNKAVVGPATVARRNLLIHGDALAALSSLAADRSRRKGFTRQVKLCYIDPPFNTGEDYA